MVGDRMIIRHGGILDPRVFPRSLLSNGMESHYLLLDSKACGSLKSFLVDK